LKVSQVSRHGDRRLLNLGHTIGHGIEKAYALPHGMAVAFGVTLAAKLSAKVKMCPLRCYDQVMELANKLSMKTESDMDWKLNDVLPYVKRDKKMVGDKLQFICLQAIGQAVVRPTGLRELRVLER
jgi:3-dehydroquinate synthase